MEVSFKPYLVLAVCGLLSLAASFLVPFLLFDFKLDGRFYVFSWSEYLKYLSAYFLAAFTIAYLTKRLILSQLLSWLHVLLTIATPLIAFYFIHEASRPYMSDISRMHNFKQNNGILVTLLYLFSASQLLLILNIILGIIKKRRS